VDRNKNKSWKHKLWAYESRVPCNVFEKCITGIDLSGVGRGCPTIKDKNDLRIEGDDAPTEMDVNECQSLYPYCYALTSYILFVLLFLCMDLNVSSKQGANLKNDMSKIWYQH